ncbi:MAG: hypothetical protein IKX97_02160 [Erysipelotrichaceae bacterium]|nr:hypothetical protein [Erysipelotrichaceae bacterium]
MKINHFYRKSDYSLFGGYPGEIIASQIEFQHMVAALSEETQAVLVNAYLAGVGFIVKIRKTLPAVYVFDLHDVRETVIDVT